MALLYDTLALPNADIGENRPSSLYWKRDDSRAIPHLVLGAGPSGGSWNKMSEHILSLSPARWLELPGYSISTWYSEQTNRPPGGEGGPIALGDVARYYRDYVEKMNLGSSIMNGTIVTAVEWVAALPGDTSRELSRRTSDESCDSVLSESDVESQSSDSFMSDSDAGSSLCGSSDSVLSDANTFLQEEFSYCESSFAVDKMLTRSCLSEVPNDSTDAVYWSEHGSTLPAKEDYCWHIQAKKTDGSNETFELYCKKLVLASGVEGNPRRLGVPGEAMPSVAHTFSDVSAKILSLTPSSTVLIVGAGLTAADAINLALQRHIHVFHVYHQDAFSRSLIYNKLSPSAYKCYTDLLQLMKGRASNCYYTSLSRSTVTEFREDGCIVTNQAMQQRTVAVDAVGVLIGSEANLDFLPPDIRSELVSHPSQPVSAKLNPVNVHPYTYECTRVPGLYAMGSLVGDTLIRFLLGGALGITQSLHTQKCA